MWFWNRNLLQKWIITWYFHIYSSLFHQQTTLGPPVLHNPSMPTRPKTRHSKQRMFFVELFGQKGDRFSKVQNIGLVDVYVLKVVEIDRVVFPPALSTDVIADVYCVKKHFWDQGTQKFIFRQNSQMDFFTITALHSFYTELNVI